jgi:hypothetical protein
MELFDLVWIGITGAASIWGYVQTRRFVRRKLRFVDAAQKPLTPLIAGGAAALIAAPLAWLPILPVGTAAAFGIGIGLGVRHGQKDVKRLPGS